MKEDAKKVKFSNPQLKIMRIKTSHITHNIHQLDLILRLNEVIQANAHLISARLFASYLYSLESSLQEPQQSTFEHP